MKIETTQHIRLMKHIKCKISNKDNSDVAKEHGFRVNRKKSVNFDRFCLWMMFVCVHFNAAALTLSCGKLKWNKSSHMKENIEYSKHSEIKSHIEISGRFSSNINRFHSEWLQYNRWSNCFELKSRFPMCSSLHFVSSNMVIWVNKWIFRVKPLKHMNVLMKRRKS